MTGRAPASVIHEDERLLVITTIEPVNPGHAAAQIRRAYRQRNALPG